MAPCSWDTDVSIVDCCDFSSYPVGKRTAALALAEHHMWAATGRRYGRCLVTVRPCQPDPTPSRFRGYPAFSFSGESSSLGMPYIRGGVWRNCGCGSRCCCRPNCYVELAGPVAAVSEVRVDGEVVASTAYRVDVVSGVWQLVRTDGTCWPTCQDFDANTGVGVFEVDYERGRAIPTAVSVATAILACEMVKSLSADPSCRLPDKLVTLTRQGISVEVQPNTREDMGYLIGIPEVDDVITADNPSRRRSRPVIYSPDMQTAEDRVTVIPAGA